MVRVMEVYRDVGFNGPYMMDYTPTLPFEHGDRLERAFAVGYMRACIQAVYR